MLIEKEKPCKFAHFAMLWTGRFLVRGMWLKDHDLKLKMLSSSYPLPELEIQKSRLDAFRGSR